MQPVPRALKVGPCRAGRPTPGLGVLLPLALVVTSSLFCFISFNVTSQEKIEDDVME